MPDSRRSRLPATCGPQTFRRTARQWPTRRAWTATSECLFAISPVIGPTRSGKARTYGRCGGSQMARSCCSASRAGIFGDSRGSAGRHDRLFGARAHISQLGPDEGEFVHSMEDMVGYQISAIDGTGSRTVYLQGFRWLIGLDWNRVTNRVLALSHEDNGAYAVWSTTPEGKDVRRHYSDTHPLHAICSSPATGAIYLLRERNDATEILRLTPSSSNRAEQRRRHERRRECRRPELQCL